MPKFLSEKVTGYLLLVTGLLTIGLSSFSIYQVFTKKAQPVKLVSSQPFKIELAPGAPPTELMSAEILNTISNLTAHYFLMSFLAMVGFKISSLGIQLLRPIEVKLQGPATSK